MTRWDKETKPVYGSVEYIDEVFTYHAPSDEQKLAYEEIRKSAKQFAFTIMQHSPKCADQSAALRLLRECVMTVNASVALEGLI